MTSVIHELVEDWVDGPAAIRRARYVLPYLSWLPMTGVVKNSSGRVLFGNGEFLDLIGSPTAGVFGKRATDYIRDRRSGELVAKLDEKVLEHRRPLLCLEQLSFGGKPQRRMAIRFPIPPDSDLELIGVLGFDLEQVESVTKSLAPETGQALQPFKTKVNTTPECDFHCLKDFLHSLPAIATVKDFEGRLLCVNSEYTKVLGKHRSEVENRFSGDIWDSSFAAVIRAHDDVVRHTGKTFASVESVPTLLGPRNRLNFRFPIFNTEGKAESTEPRLVMTGTLGFDYELLRRGVDRLKRSSSPASAHLFLPAEEKDSLKQVYSAS
ncbi:MAG: PAS domain-containing protein [Acidobacteriia bacterium]|nr:PAS domain-containing protein [Terriglobia bacterium]